MMAICNPRPGAEMAAARKRRVLVVDDDHDFAESLAAALERAGYHVAVSSDPREVRAASDNGAGPWDALVSDPTLPGMSGTALIGCLKQRNPAMACILCTGYTSGLFNRRQAIRHGADAFFRKPVQPATLVDIITLAVKAGRGEPSDG